MSNREKIVVTGGNGFIGSHMCKFLHEKGYDVHIIDNYQTSPRQPVHPYGSFYELDMASDQAGQLISQLKPTAIFHFAARSIVSQGEANPELYQKDNVEKSRKLMDFCEAANVECFIFSSTCAIFGKALTEKISEDHPQCPCNVYGKTKLQIENDLKQRSFKALALRYFNAAGAAADGTLGENHDPETHLIPNLCLSLVNNGEFYLFGANHPTADGTCVRDYIHVDDLARAHYLGWQYLQKKSGFHAFNLGSEAGYSVREILTVFEEVSQTKVNLVEKPPRAGDPPRLVSDSSLAKRELNFKTNKTLKDCVADTWSWFRDGKRIH